MPKTEYTQDDYIRAILRSAISTTNRRLEKILNQYLEGSVVLRGNNGSVYLESRGRHMEQVFDKSYACLNENFFYSSQNDVGARFIAQLFTILSRGRKVQEQLIDYRQNMGPNVNIDLELLSIVMAHGEKNRKEYNDYIIAHRDDPKLTREELHSKAERAQTKLNGEDYEEWLVKAGYSGRKLEQAKLFLDVLGKQYSQSRIIDFLDTYTLYHYYLFRDTINKRFTDYCDRNPHASLREKQIMFEKIVQQEMTKHAKYSSCKENAFFDRSHMSLASRRIDSKRAKSLSIDVMDGTDGSKRLLMAKLQSKLNETVPNETPIEIRDFEFRPRPKQDIRALGAEARRKVLEGAKLLTSVNCGMIVNNDYIPLVDNDFYLDTNSGYYSKKPAYTTPKPQPKPQSSTPHEYGLEEERRKMAEEAKKYTNGKQLTFF